VTFWTTTYHGRRWRTGRDAQDPARARSEASAIVSAPIRFEGTRSLECGLRVRDRFLSSCFRFGDGVTGAVNHRATMPRSVRSSRIPSVGNPTNGIKSSMNPCRRKCERVTTDRERPAFGMTKSNSCRTARSRSRRDVFSVALEPRSITFVVGRPTVSRSRNLRALKPNCGDSWPH